MNELNNLENKNQENNKKKEKSNIGLYLCLAFFVLALVGCIATAISQ